MDYAKALTFLWEDPRWKEKVAIGTGVMLVSGLLMPVLIGFVGILIVMGYGVRVLQNVRDGNQYPLPEWDQWSEDLALHGRSELLAIGGRPARYLTHPGWDLHETGRPSKTPSAIHAISGLPEVPSLLRIWRRPAWTRLSSAVHRSWPHNAAPITWLEFQRRCSVSRASKSRRTSSPCSPTQPSISSPALRVIGRPLQRKGVCRPHPLHDPGLGR